MAGYQFDELTKDLAGAKSRRGFLKGLLATGLAAAGVALRMAPETGKRDGAAVLSRDGWRARCGAIGESQQPLA